MGNSNGSYQTTAANMMLAFDSLPAECRDAFRQCAYDFVPQPMRTRLKRGGSIRQNIIELLNANADHIGKEAYRLYGEDHPQAVKPTRIKRK